jgi:hypothetical protein
VQTGDYFDRGTGVRDVVDLLMRLEGEARRAGGRVDVLLGNHEGMNLLHDFRDVSPELMKSFADARSEERRAQAYAAHAAVATRAGTPIERDGWMQAHPPGYLEYAEAIGPSSRYGRWLRSRKVMVKVDDTIFMHAGVSPEQEGSLDEINRAVEREIRAFDNAVSLLSRAGLIAPFFTLREIVAAAGLEIERIAAAQKAKEDLPPHVTRELVEALQHLARVNTWALIAPQGPLWFRGYATWGPQSQPQVQQVLMRFGAARFVSGHTTLPGKIASRFNGRVFLIDTGMLTTHYKGGRPSALEIQDGTITAVYPDSREPVGKAAAGSGGGS